MTVSATVNNPAIPTIPPGGRMPRPQDFEIELQSLPTWVRPEVVFWYRQWRKIRDACWGERVVKDGQTYYLPPMPGQEPSEYMDYLDRATYYNFSERTVSS